MVEVYRTHTPELQLYDDAKWALSNYQNMKFGIITDGYLETQKNKIKALGIKDLFDVIVCTDEYGKDCWKPSQFPYKKVMEATAKSGKSCVYIGDNPAGGLVEKNRGLIEDCFFIGKIVSLEGGMAGGIAGRAKSLT